MRRSAAIVGLAALATMPAAAQTPTTLHVASNAGDDLTPLLYAQKAGLFAKAGLDVQIAKMNSGSTVTAAVIGGSVDIGKSSTLPLVSARAHGFPLKIVAPGAIRVYGLPIEGMLVRKDSPIVAARDLTGKTIAVAALGDLNQIGARAWIDQNGGDSKAVHYLELPGSAVAGALAEGRVDAVNIGDPVYSKMIASGQVRLLCRPADAIAKRFLVSGFFSTEAFLAKNGDAVARFAHVLRDAGAYTNTHHAETLDLTADFWGIDPALLASMTRTTAGTAVDPRDLQPLVDVAAKYGLIDSIYDARALVAPLALAT